MKNTPLHLLTREDKIKLTNSFRDSFHRKDQLLLPDDEFYPTIYEKKDIEKVSKKICVWLGIKPHTLHFLCNDELPDGYIETNKKHCINLTTKSRNNPLVAAAIIARGCMVYYLYRKDYTGDSELIEIGLIELGLGLLVLNAIDSGSNLRDRFYRTIPIKHRLQIDDSVLSYFGCEEYIRLFSKYISRNELDHRIIVEHLTPWVRKHTDIHITTSTKLKEQDFVALQIHKRSINRQKIFGLGLLIITLLTPGIFFWQKRPHGLPITIQRQKEDIEVLEAAYQSCENSLQYKKDTYDMTDFFMIRQIDAHLGRCKSIRNKHDHSVKIYNSQVANYE